MMRNQRTCWAICEAGRSSYLAFFKSVQGLRLKRRYGGRTEENPGLDILSNMPKMGKRQDV
jgi:hypothetical protein